MRRYDVVVLGTGAAGQTAAAACAEAGRSVAVVDRLPYGGTCAQRGCDPKKVLLAAAEAVVRARMLAEGGVSGACAIDWPALVARMRGFTEPVPERIEGWLGGLGVDLLHGEAAVVGDLEIAVDGERIVAGDLVVATGSRPRTLGIPGEQLLTTSDAFMRLDRLPARIVLVGGGYISFEFAWLARAAGAEVTIVHRSEHVLRGFDPRLAGMLVERYRGLGVQVVTGAELKEIGSSDGRFELHTGGGDFDADLAVHGAGRVADVAGLGLDSVGVAAGERGVEVGPDLRSKGHPRVWAAGDAASLGMPLTPVATAQGRIVAANILGARERFEPAVTPSVVFSDPPLAAIGLGAAEAAKDPERYEVVEADMTGWFTQARLGRAHPAGAIFVAERSTGAVVGAHLLGQDAEELANLLALAIRERVSRERLRSALWAYPTAGHDLTYLL